MRLLLVISGWGVLVLCAGLAAALFVGSRLPVAHEASRSVVLSAAPAEVYAVITDFAGAPSWRAGLKRVETVDAAASLRFREHGAHGAVTYEVVRAEPERLLVTRIVDEDLGYSGSWTYTLAPEGTGTRLTITENGIVTNAFFRFMSRFVFGHTRTIDDYLRSLAAHLQRRRAA